MKEKLKAEGIMPGPDLMNLDKPIGSTSFKCLGNGTFLEIQDSGAREDFSTGSVRDTRGGKGRFDLITPFALRRIAKHYEGGAVKYGDRNWEKGQKIMRFLDSAERHVQDLKAALLLGEQTEDHAAAIIWNMMSYVHTEEMLKIGRLPAELDDRPEPYKAYGTPEHEHIIPKKKTE